MMMMRTAGGPAEPVWTRTRPRNRLPAWVWVAAVASVGVHVAAGAWLMTQRWTPPVVRLDEGPIIDLLPPPAPKRREPQKPVERTVAKPAPQTKLNVTPTPTQPTETLDYVPSDAARTTSGPISLQPLPDAQEGGTATEVAPEIAPLGVVTNPDWVRKPSAEALMRAYPERALNAGTEGSVALNCAVRVDGTLTGCSVTSETPAGQGFGRAALRLSRDFRMSPRTVDGQAVGGARVSVTLRFTQPER